MATIKYGEQQLTKWASRCCSHCYLITVSVSSWLSCTVANIGGYFGTNPLKIQIKVSGPAPACQIYWFIKTISRRFISQEIEHKWLVLPPGAKTLGAQNSFNCYSVVMPLRERRDSGSPDPDLRQRYQNTCFCIDWEMLLPYFEGKIFYIVFCHLFSIGHDNESLWRDGINCVKLWVIKVKYRGAFNFIIYYGKRR